VIIRPPPPLQSRHHLLPLVQQVAHRAMALNQLVVSNQTVNWEVLPVGKATTGGFWTAGKIVKIQKFCRELFFLTKRRNFYIFIFFDILFIFYFYDSRGVYRVLNIFVEVLHCSI
jgi:hypothetical protein